MVREMATQVDWPCQVKTLFRERNLGCKDGVSGAITWFFDYEEQGIVLEDDCVPHPDFFTFCESLLVRYADDERISVITGNNFQNGFRRGDAAYYFSRYNHCWGWASWRRAWRNYRGDLQFWPNWRASDAWSAVVRDKVERRFWSMIFDRVYRHEIDSWAYPWTASVWHCGGLTATPNVNLVSNIGFGAAATHTTSTASDLSKMAVYPLGQLSHPSEVLQDEDADRYVFDMKFGGRNLRWPRRLFWLPWRIPGALYRLLKARFA